MLGHAPMPQQAAAKPLRPAAGREGEEVVFNSVLLGAHIVPPGNGEYPHGKVVIASAAREIVASEQDVRAQFPVVALDCVVLGTNAQSPVMGLHRQRPEGRGVADDCPPP